MTLAHLLPATLLLCSLSAFAQDRQPTSLAGKPVADTRGAAATPSEPWKINQPADANLRSTSPDRQQIDQYHINQYQVDQFRIDRNRHPFILEADADAAEYLGQPGACYAIRSYVVARDNKDSDSTHLVGYSTCRPSSRYHVKTVEGGASSIIR